MGKLISGAIEVEFDDRALVHLQSVIGSKLRRGESRAGRVNRRLSFLHARA